MSQTAKLQKDKIVFTTTNSTTGEISYDNVNDKFNFDRAITANGGIVATGMTVNPGATANFQGYGDINVQSLGIYDDTTGKVTLDCPASVTDYTIKLPSTQGAANTVLTNDGSGNLSFANPSQSWSTYATVTSGFTNSNTNYTLDITSFKNGTDEEMLISVKTSIHTSQITLYRSLLATLESENSKIEVGKFSERYALFTIQNSQTQVFIEVSGVSLSKIIAWTR